MKNRVGEVNYNTFGSKMEIIEYNTCDNIIVKFEEYNCCVRSRYGEFKSGEIKCDYEKRYSNHGYLGYGRFNLKNSKNIFSIWSNMIKRCYSVNCAEYSAYQDVTVCDEWHNFQKFAEWYSENYYSVPDEKMHLDKDILIKGNKIYSPKTCAFVPQSINKLFTKRERDRGECPLGVSYHKGIRKYTAQVSIDGKLKHLGVFNDKYDAFRAYKYNKENEIKRLADKYKNYISGNLYDSLYNYKIDIND